MKRVLIVAGIVAIVAAAMFVGRGRTPAPPAPPPTVAGPEPAGPEPRPVPVDDEIKRAEKVLDSEERNVRALAAEWRGRARQDPDFLRRLAALVLDDATSPKLRELAALVLGSIAGSRDVLARALREAKDPSWTLVLLLAMGSDTSWTDDDDVFDLPDSPRVIVTPLGLAVRIRGTLADPEARAAMIDRTRGSEGARVRWAAALALADSTSFPDVRRAYLAALPGERDPATEGEISKALSEWIAGQPADSPDRATAVTALLDGAVRPEAGALRHRSEEGLKRMAWTSAEVRALAPSIEAGTLDQRRWAIAVLAGAASRPETPDRDLVFDSLSRVAGSAAEPKVREFAVTGLSAFRDRAEAEKVLVAALGDAAWHVRIAAVRALGRASGESRSSLERIEKTDPDERVRRAAGEVLRK